jgi:hypothetical protein
LKSSFNGNGLAKNEHRPNNNDENNYVKTITQHTHGTILLAFFQKVKELTYDPLLFVRLPRVAENS